jgi:HlyD family secretion protein
MLKSERLSALEAIHADTDATIFQVASQAGTAIEEAQPLMTVVPLNSPLEAEVQIANEDIGLVRVGMPARIKIGAFPFERYGWLVGRVRAISPDSQLSVPQSAQTGQTQSPAPQSAYRAFVAVTGSKLHDLGPTFRLLPGMTVNAELQLGTRSVASYLFDPLRRHFATSLSEPR